MLQANLISLRSVAGIDSGYINMVLAGDWVVRNMPVMPESDYPYSLLSTEFDLGVNEGTDIESITAVVLYSDDVKLSAPSTTSATFSVGSRVRSNGGLDVNARGARGSTTPPVLNDVIFGDPTNTRAIFQLDHPNIQAASNQCYPMGVANSLQFLANTTDLSLPHSHVQGLKGDNSLVGQLDTHMNRVVTNRTNGAPVGDIAGLQGKMNYLLANGLEDRIQTRHWGRFAGNTPVSVSLNGKTATSTNMGLAVSFDMVVTALEGGENCEAGYTHSTGGHVVDIVAAGFTNGQPWMIEASDDDQTSDTKGTGAEGFVFSNLVDTDNDGDFNMNGTSQELDLVICQKYVPPTVPTGISLPPPETEFVIPSMDLSLLEEVDLGGHSPFVGALPSQVSANFFNNTLIIDANGGAPSYFPLELELDPNGGLSGSNNATVAGFPNISNLFVGEIGDDSLIIDITNGAAGGLPGGQPLQRSFELVPSPSGFPWAFQDAPPETSTSIRINGFRDDQILDPGDPFSIGLGLNPGPGLDSGELWLAVQTGDLILSFDLESGDWIEGLHPLASGPLGAVGNQPIFTLPNGGLPPGDYTLHFGVDEIINNNLDMDSLILDSVNVTLETTGLE